MNDVDKTATPMWKYQVLFREGADKVAKEVFNRLDDKLRPRVFLLGASEAQEDELMPVCLEPADEYGYDPKFFSGVLYLAGQIEEAAAKKRGGRRPEESQERPISNESIQQAVEQMLNDAEEGSKFVSHCSLPTAVGGYRVCCVLQFDAEAYRSHFSLPVKPSLPSRRAASLISATATEFLKVCAGVLRDDKAGIDIFDTLGRESEEILRMGGRELIGATYVGWPKIFDALNSLSWKTHEGELADGEIHFFYWDAHQLEMLVEFKFPPELQDIGAARKIIEMAKAKKLVKTDNDRLYLVSRGTSIDGIGYLKELKGLSDRHLLDGFVVRFTGYYRWELRYKDGKGKDDRIMMQVINGVPSLPSSLLSEEKFRDHVQRRFTKSVPNEDALWEIVNDAARQKHGTMIVISSDAAKEAERLEGQSTAFRNPVRLTEKILLMLSSIDGAVLVDPAGLCYAAGVILDGNAVKGKGARSRGARYNSAIRYIHTAEKESDCMAVVVSEDGAIDLVPALYKRIRRSEITERIEKLCASVALEIVNAEEYYQALDWLSAHRFYLSQDMCPRRGHCQRGLCLPLLAGRKPHW